MEFRILPLILSFVLVGLGSTARLWSGGENEAQEIASKVKEWLESKKYILNVEVTEDAADPQSGLTELKYPEAAKYGPIFTHHSDAKKGPIFISIAFSKDVTPSSTVQDLQNTLNFVALNELPMPGFQYPAGWKVYPLTPVSSFKDGVQIVSFQNGRLHFKVYTRFFAIYGKMRGLPDIGDAGDAKDTYFEVQEDIVGEIDVNMPLIFS